MGSLQEDLTKKDPRLPPSGLDKVEEPPGNWPSTSTTGHAGDRQPLPSCFAGHRHSPFLDQCLPLASHPCQKFASIACNLTCSQLSMLCDRALFHCSPCLSSKGSRSECIRCSTTHHAGFPEDPPASSARAAGDPDAGKVDKDAPGLEDQDPRAEGSPSPGSEADPSTERAPGAHGASQPLLFVMLCTCAHVGTSSSSQMHSDGVQEPQSGQVRAWYVAV